jgi:hypothetical protein
VFQVLSRNPGPKGGSQKVPANGTAVTIEAEKIAQREVASAGIDARRGLGRAGGVGIQEFRAEAQAAESEIDLVEKLVSHDQVERPEEPVLSKIVVAKRNGGVRPFEKGTSGKAGWNLRRRIVKEDERVVQEASSAEVRFDPGAQIQEVAELFTVVPEFLGRELPVNHGGVSFDGKVPERMTPEVAFEKRDFPLESQASLATLEARVRRIDEDFHAARQVTVPRLLLAGGSRRACRTGREKRSQEERSLEGCWRSHDLQIRRFPEQSSPPVATDS